MHINHLEVTLLKGALNFYIAPEMVFEKSGVAGRALNAILQSNISQTKQKQLDFKVGKEPNSRDVSSKVRTHRKSVYLCGPRGG
jgi:hypothetical protein